MELKNNKYLILWEPSGILRAFIEKWKNKIYKVDPNAEYLNHLVHSTLYVFNSFEKEEYLIKELNVCVGNMKSFLIDIKNWKIFYNDVLTNSNTLTLEIKKNKHLFNVQKEVVNTLNKLRSNKIQYDNVIWKNEYLESYNRFGFPFVGVHWIPHITVASISDNSGFNIEEAFDNKVNFLSVDFNALSLYSIDNNIHKKIKTFKIDN